MKVKARLAEFRSEKAIEIQKQCISTAPVIVCSGSCNEIP